MKRLTIAFIIILLISNAFAQSKSVLLNKKIALADYNVWLYLSKVTVDQTYYTINFVHFVPTSLFLFLFL